MARFNFQAMLLCLFVSLFIQPAHGQGLDSLMNLNAFTEESELQKILNKNVTVSSQKALTTRETPGIISLITSEEIQNSGARDLTDILRMVPGFDVMQDLQFAMGIGLRGNWANEGKVLVMMDGQPFNELLYQTVAVGNRFPVDAIERIEIIRGPGSAIYGGSAEYGVINIITKAAETLNGVAVYGTGGFFSNAVGRTNGGVMIGKKGADSSFDLSFFKGKGIVSNRPYTELGGADEYDLAKVTNADPTNINVGIRKKGFQFRTMYDAFSTSDPILFISYKSFVADLKYAWKISKRFTLTPQIKYFSQIPWSYGDAATHDYAFKVRANRYYGGLTAIYDVSKKVNINLGVLYFQDNATDLLEGQYFGGENALSLSNYAFFAQSFVKHRLANATVGFRFEQNNKYGSAFVPRLALTKKIQNFHFKILYSQSFRAPSIENINLAKNESIKPEKSNVGEVELGYQFTPEMLLAINAFNIATRQVIVYANDVVTNEQTYTNYDKSGTQGVELVYSLRKKKFYANISYSFSQAIAGNTVDIYAVPQTTKQFAGNLAHKIACNTNFYLTDNLSINPVLIYGGKRYAYTTLVNGDPESNELRPYLLTNIFINYRNLFVSGFTLGAGVYDLLDQHPDIPQAYNGGYAPIPGRSREYVIKLSYQLDFSNK